MLYFAALVLLIVSAFSGVFMAVKFMEERQRRWLAALAGCIVVLLISGFILVFGEWAISKENAQVALVTCLFLAVVIISVAFGPHEKEET